MDRRTIQLSFTGGEISPELYGRPDAVQYRTGAALLNNWIVKPQGPVRTRPGFRHVATSDGLGTGGGTRLIPFVYSTGESYVIEIGRRDSAWETDAGSAHTYARFYARGAAVKWAVPVELGEASVCLNAATDTFGAVHPHGFFTATSVVLIAEVTGTLPTGYAAGTTHYVRNFTDFSSKRFQLSTAASGGSVLNVSGGNKKLYAYKKSDLPAAWTDDPATGDFVQVADKYTVGDLVYWPGTGGTNRAGVYHCRGTHVPSSSGSTDTFDARVASGSWHIQPADGTLELRLPTDNYYSTADLSKLVWRQSGDTLWLANGGQSYPLLEINRISALLWSSTRAAFNSRIVAPTDFACAPNRGDAFSVDRNVRRDSALGGNNLSSLRFANVTRMAVTIGDAVYVDNISNFTPDEARLQNIAGSTSAFVEGVYIVTNTYAPSAGGVREIALKTVAGDKNLTIISSLQWAAGECRVFYSSVDANSTQEYKITSIDDDDLESQPSTTLLQSNQVLSVRGAKNELTWTAATGAKRYRIYKKKSGLFGYIGESDTTSFTDDNIAPELGRTPPIDDPTITERDTATRRPGSVGGYEQRMLLASTAEKPQTIWGSKSGTELDFTYTLPVLADNRLRFTLASNQAQTVRHMVGLRDLIVLTQSGEWRVRGSDDGALTPATLFARQEGFVGASFVQPASLNDTVVYVANRGGHLRKLSFAAQRGGFQGMDASLRAAHLFDELDVLALASGKAPFPVVWAVSSNGKLLGLTFIPEEQVESWHQHTTEGTFIDCCCVPEFERDVVYVTVDRKDSAGGTVRSIERMQEWQTADVANAACLDDHASTYSSVSPSHPYDTGMRVLATGGLSEGDEVQLQGRNSADNNTQVVFDLSDLHDEVWVYVGTARYRAKITGYVNSTLVNATLLDTLPATALTTFTETDWRFVRRRIYVPSRYASRTVTIVADGVVSTATATASTQIDNAYVDLDAGALNVHVGDAFTCDLQTLPVAVQIDGLGVGKEKNVDKAWLRVLNASGLQVGPDVNNLVAVSDIQTGATLQTGEKRTLVSPNWNEDGQLLVRQSNPFPATVLSLSAQVSFGS